MISRFLFASLLFISLLAFPSGASAQNTQSGSGSLQGQGSGVQSTGSGLQTGSSLQQDTTSLNSLTQSPQTVPLGTSDTATQPTATANTGSNGSLAKTLLIIFACLGALLFGVILWGAVSSPKPEATAPEPAKKPKKKKSKTTKKKKKAHR